MHIILYTFNRYTARADAFQSAMEAEGHTVVRLAARYFDGVAEPCDKCVIEWDAVRRVEHVYKAAGIPTEVIGAPTRVETPADIPAPRKRGRPRKDA